MITRCCVCLFIFCIILLPADIIQYLKPVQDKSTRNSIKNIDFIYMINLDHRPEKWKLSSDQLAQFGIYPCRFSAINGMELSLEVINNIGIKYESWMTPLLGTTYLEKDGKIIKSLEFMTESGKTYFWYGSSKDAKPALGAIGCALSHISILQDAYDSGYETIWVMEDDIEILDDPHRISDLIEELDKVVGASNWDVLFTDIDYRSGVEKYVIAYGAAKRPDMDCSLEERYSDKYTKTIKVNEHFNKIAARFGTASMIIRRSGIIRLLEFSKNRHIYLPYDLENYLPKNIKRYGLTFDLVTNMLNSISDIGKEDKSAF